MARCRLMAGGGGVVDMRLGFALTLTGEPRSIQFRKRKGMDILSGDRNFSIVECRCLQFQKSFERKALTTVDGRVFQVPLPHKASLPPEDKTNTSSHKIGQQHLIHLMKWHRTMKCNICNGARRRPRRTSASCTTPAPCNGSLS